VRGHEPAVNPPAAAQDGAKNEAERKNEAEPLTVGSQAEPRNQIFVKPQGSRNRVSFRNPVSKKPNAQCDDAQQPVSTPQLDAVVAN
jgi:hypothetical protein